jgi:3-oxoacyl-[acyl-carrier-protein] synthase II
MNQAINQTIISGMGWVSESSRGYPGHVCYSINPHGLPKISGKEILDRPHKAFGRMDNFSKIGFAAITFALADVGIARSEPKKNIAVIASSITGCLETDIHYQATLSREKGIFPSPTLFAYTLPSCFLGEASIYHGLTGESFMVEEEIPNGLQGLSLGLDLLEDGGCDVLVCGLCNSDIKLVNPTINVIFPEFGALFFVLEKKGSKPSHGIITESRAQNIFSFEGKKINSLTDLGKNILAQKTN